MPGSIIRTAQLPGRLFPKPCVELPITAPCRAAIGRHFTRSLPSALRLGERYMSTSIVTLTKRFSINRPATLLNFDPSKALASVLGGDIVFLRREKYMEVESPEAGL